MKKKVIAGLLGTAMVASLLAGCGSSNNTTDTTADTAAATEAAADTTADTAAADAESEAQSVADAAGDVDLSNADVAVMYYTYGDTYIASVRTALDAKLDELGVKYQDYDANNNQTTQNEQIDTAIQTGANVLIVNIVTSGSVDASSQIVEKAKAADIPVIFFNRAVEGDEDEGKVLGSYDKCAFVGTDAPEAGHMQGEMIGNYLVDNYDAVDLNGDGKISYAMFMGQLGNVEAIYRTQYGVEDANKVLEENGKAALEYFDSSNTDCYQVDQDGNWSATAANNYMTTNLTQYNEENKTIPVFGVDATDAAKQLIKDGKMTGTIKQDAEGMADCIADLTKNAGSGQDVMANTDSYNISENVKNKIYIPYAMSTGEE